MGEREDRMARNEALFRSVNERMNDLAVELSLPGAVDASQYFCECGDQACVEKIALPLAEYEAIRAHPTRFLVSRGHDCPEIERVVARQNGYLVVEKLPGEAMIAMETDPRG